MSVTNGIIGTGPGGRAYGWCEKHGVPLIHTITESVLCAVCEAARADAAEKKLKEIESARDRNRQVAWAMMSHSMDTIAEAYRDD